MYRPKNPRPPVTRTRTRLLIVSPRVRADRHRRTWASAYRPRLRPHPRHVARYPRDPILAARTGDETRADAPAIPETSPYASHRTAGPQGRSRIRSSTGALRAQRGWQAHEPG